MKELKNLNKEALIKVLLEKKSNELDKIIGGLKNCEAIGCGPGYCMGTCPDKCLSNCMAAPSCTTNPGPGPL
jgi:hypothetical protein